MGNTAEIKILGHKLRVAGDGDEGHLLTLADFVNAKLEEVKGGVPKNLPLQNLLILGLLNLADEHLQYRKETGDRIERASVKVRGLIEMIEHSG